MSVSITAVHVSRFATAKGERISVQVFLNDLCYFKGDVKMNKEQKPFIVFSNSPWKNDKGDWKNNYLAGFVDDEMRNKIEAFVLNVVASGKDFVNPDAKERVHYDALMEKWNKNKKNTETGYSF